MSHNDYRMMIRRHLETKLLLRPSYSLRSFARFVGLSAPYLSQVLQRKKNLSINAAKKISVKIFDNVNEQARFILLVQIEKAKTEQQKFDLQNELEAINTGVLRQPFFPNDLAEEFNWYDSAIVNLAEADKGKLTPSSISKRLGVSLEIAEMALKKAIERGDLLKLDDGTYRRNFELMGGRSPLSPESLANYAEQTINKAHAAVREVPPDQSFFASLTFAFDPEQSTQLITLIEKFLGDARGLSKNGKNRSEVYHTSIQMFRMSKR